MGETVVNIKIASLEVITSKNSRWEEISVLVDTGASYTTVPTELLEMLGVEKKDKICLQLADGREVDRYLGTALVEVDGRQAPTPVIFGEPHDATVLGVVTLEECRLSVDPINKKLVPVIKIHHYEMIIPYTKVK